MNPEESSAVELQLKAEVAALNLRLAQQQGELQRLRREGAILGEIRRFAVLCSESVIVCNNSHVAESSFDHILALATAAQGGRP